MAQVPISVGTRWHLAPTSAIVQRQLEVLPVGVAAVMGGWLDSFMGVHATAAADAEGPGHVLDGRDDGDLLPAFGQGDTLEENSRKAKILRMLVAAHWTTPTGRRAGQERLRVRSQAGPETSAPENGAAKDEASTLGADATAALEARINKLEAQWLGLLLNKHFEKQPGPSRGADEEAAEEAGVAPVDIPGRREALRGAGHPGQGHRQGGLLRCQIGGVGPREAGGRPPARAGQGAQGGGRGAGRGGRALVLGGSPELTAGGALK